MLWFPIRDMVNILNRISYENLTHIIIHFIIHIITTEIMQSVEHLSVDNRREKQVQK